LLADVDAGGDEDGAAVGDVLTVADGDGDADGRTDGEAVAVGDADGRTDGRTDGEAVAVGWYVPVYEGALAEYDALGETEGLAGAPKELCAADAEAAGADVCAVGLSLTGAGEGPVKEVSAKAVAPDASTSTPMTHASTIGRHRRRRGRSGPADGLPWVACVAEPAAVVCVIGPGSGAARDAAGAAPGPSGTWPDGSTAAPDGTAQAKVRTNESGSQSPPGCMAPTASSSPAAVGRRPGSFARQRSTNGRTAGGTRSRSGAP
jgi:hypothetical protein